MNAELQLARWIAAHRRTLGLPTKNHAKTVTQLRAPKLPLSARSRATGTLTLGATK